MNYGHVRPPHPIAGKLRQARLQHGWSQARMAEGARVHQGVISRVEVGKTSDPHLWTVVDMAAALGMEIHLVDEEEWW